MRLFLLFYVILVAIIMPRSSRQDESSSDVSSTLKDMWRLDNSVTRMIASDAPLTRDSRPFCSCYGLDRNRRYAGKSFKFCNNCEKADEKELENMMKGKVNFWVNRKGYTYRCTSQHESWTEPTHVVIRPQRDVVATNVMEDAPLSPSRRKDPPSVINARATSESGATPPALQESKN